jgi:hypothetical protein
MIRLLSLLAAVLLSTLAAISPSLAQGCDDGPPPAPAPQGDQPTT